MSWYDKYKPKKLDDFIFNRNLIRDLRNFTPSLTHFRLIGDYSSGRRSILNLYLKELGINKSNIFYINYENIKTCENKDKLYHFLDFKSNQKKFIVIHHISSISNKFVFELINLLKQDDAIVAIIDNEATSSDLISKYVIDFKIETFDFNRIGEYILKNEDIKYEQKDLKDIISKSSNYYDFVHYLELKFKYNNDFKNNAIDINFELIFNEKSLKKRLIEIRNIENDGFEQSKILSELMNYDYCNYNNVEYALIIGEGIEFYNNHQNEEFEIYRIICQLWQINKK